MVFVLRAPSTTTGVGGSGCWGWCVAGGAGRPTLRRTLRPCARVLPGCARNEVRVLRERSDAPEARSRPFGASPAPKARDREPVIPGHFTVVGHLCARNAVIAQASLTKAGRRPSLRKRQSSLRTWAPSLGRGRRRHGRWTLVRAQRRSSLRKSD